MSAASDLLDSNPRVDFDFERDVMPATLVWPQILDFGALARRPAGAARHRANPFGRARRIIARADDHRKNELIPAIYVGQGVIVFDLHVDLFARLNVGDRLCEDVWPFLS